MHDWLGDGIYFWENDPARALQFSKERMRWKGIVDKEPKVIGAIIDLGLCLNLFEQPALNELAVAYEDLEFDFQIMEKNLPVNSEPGRIWARDLDCAVIDTLHVLREREGLPRYDSVRSSFQEGAAAFPGTEFRKKNHIQIAVRSTSCIKGYFLPRE